MLATIVTENQDQESSVYSYNGNLFSFAKIVSETQAKEFVEFAVENFNALDN